MNVTKTENHPDLNGISFAEIKESIELGKYSIRITPKLLGLGMLIMFDGASAIFSVFIQLLPFITAIFLWFRGAGKEALFVTLATCFGFLFKKDYLVFFLLLGIITIMVSWFIGYETLLFTSLFFTATVFLRLITAIFTSWRITNLAKNKETTFLHMFHIGLISLFDNETKVPMWSLEYSLIQNYYDRNLPVPPNISEIAQQVRQESEEHTNKIVENFLSSIK